MLGTLLMMTALQSVYARCSVDVAAIPYLTQEGYRWALQQLSEERWQTLMNLLISNQYLNSDQASCLSFWLPTVIKAT